MSSKKRKFTEAFAKEFLELKKENNSKKTIKNLAKAFKGKTPLDILQTHESDLKGEIKDFKLTYQIRQAVKTGNIQASNTLISLFGKQKKLDAVMLLYSSLIKAGIWPSVYTFTGLINACVRCSELSRAASFFTDMTSVGLKPNAVTYTVLIKGQCQESLIEEAMKTLRKMKGECVNPNIRTFNTILRGCWRCGKLKIARKVIAMMGKEGVQPDVTSHEYFIRTLCEFLKVKEAWELAKGIRKQGINQGGIYAAIATAAALKGRFQLALKTIQMARECIALNVTNTKGFKDLSKGSQKSVDMFLEMKNEEVERECQRIEDFLKTHPKKSSFSLKASPNVILFPLSSPTLVNINTLFPSQLPVKLEICSGHGDWIIERASQSQTTANWLALEIRFERVYTIFSKLNFKHLENLAILGGEANHIISNHLPPGILDEVFINYPDPPVWEFSQWLLISEAFLRVLHRVLIRGRHVTIVTDDREYAGLMVREFKKVPELFRSKIKGKDLSNEIPAGYGSSYFDRFWTQGNRTSRFFLQYEAIDMKITTKPLKNNNS